MGTRQQAQHRAAVPNAVVDSVAAAIDPQLQLSKRAKESIKRSA